MNQNSAAVLKDASIHEYDRACESAHHLTATSGVLATISGAGIQVIINQAEAVFVREIPEIPNAGDALKFALPVFFMVVCVVLFVLSMLLLLYALIFGLGKPALNVSQIINSGGLTIPQNIMDGTLARIYAEMTDLLRKKNGRRRFAFSLAVVCLILTVLTFMLSMI